MALNLEVAIENIFTKEPAFEVGVKRPPCKDDTMRLGSYDAILKDNSKIRDIYKSRLIKERHRHRYEVDISYKEKFEKNGLVFSGLSPDNKLPEIIELKNHPWFIGVQFHPLIHDHVT